MAVEIPFTKKMYDLLKEATKKGPFQENIALYPVEIPLQLWEGLVEELGDEMKAGLFVNVMLVLGARHLIDCHSHKFEDGESN